MDGVPTGRRLTGWLALAALALQFAVSFAHVHAPEIAAPAAAHLETPGHTGDSPDLDHDCPACMVRHLAGTPILAAEPSLSVPAHYTTFSHIVAAASAGIHSRITTFDARGPPQA